MRARRRLEAAVATTAALLVLGSLGTAVTSAAAARPASVTVTVIAPTPPTAAPGQVVSVTLSVADGGTRAAARTKVTVTLPAVVSGQPTVVLRPAPGVVCKARRASPRVSVCTVGRVAAGASAPLGTLVATPPPSATGALSTTVTVTGPSTTVTVPLRWGVPLPTLTTSVVLGPTALELGQWVTGTLTVANTGFAPAAGFLTNVPLPSTADPDALVSESPGTSCIPYYGILQCSMPGLAPGASATAVWSFQPQVGPSAQVTATADVQGLVVQGSRAGDVATSNTVTISGTGARLSVTSSNAPTVPQGSNWQRQLTVTNAGDTPAFNTVVQDWSGSFAYLGTVSGGTCAQFTIGVGGKGGSHPVTAGTQCSIGTVPAGGSVSVTFELEATPTQAVTTYSNKVVVSTTTPVLADLQGTSTVAIVVPSGPVAPAALVAPAAPTGNVVVGDTLSVGTGSWNGTPTIGFGYQWRDCDSSGGACTPIAGATGSTYTVQAADVGSTIDCAVTASNGGGSATVDSPPTVPAIAAAAPTVVSPPTVVPAGEPAVGVTYLSTPGTWSGTPVITFTYQWYRCDSTGTSCTAIAGATAADYVLTAADVGTWLEVQVTATNTGGSLTAVSDLATTGG